MRTLLWVARHGTTTDSGKHIFRGQRDSSLDKDGFLGAHEQKKFFEKHDWDKIFTSDMKRACQTAVIIAGDRDKDIMPPLKKLRPWHIGEITGKDKKAYGKVMEHFINNPDEKIPGGEARNEFETGRVKPLFAEGIKRGFEKGIPSIFVTSSSDIHALTHLIHGEAGEHIAVKPGGIIEVYLEDGEIKIRAVLKPGKDDSSFAAGSTS
jgi:broad specificity phosphatase PhoE